MGSTEAYKTLGLYISIDVSTYEVLTGWKFPAAHGDSPFSSIMHGEGNLMPRLLAILASLISVTFIALGEVPKKWLHSTFHVRRQVVSNALQWLKVNNLKYYRDIEISPTRINTLPEDDVPEEITAIIRQSEDLGVLEEEDDSYMPPDDNEGQQFE